MPPVIVPHPNTIRGPIEEAHNATRDAREKQYITDRKALEDDYHADLAAIQTAKEDALFAAGLNRDGGTPEDYPNPFMTVAPAVTGTPQTGQTLTCDDGTWVNADSFTYQWVRDGVDIAGATANTRVLVAADEGKILKCRVTATNEWGSTSKDSNSVTPTP